MQSTDMLFMFPTENLPHHPPASDTCEEWSRIFRQRVEVSTINCTENDISDRRNERKFEDL